MEFKKYIKNPNYKDKPEEAKEYWKRKAEDDIIKFMRKYKIYDSKMIANQYLNSSLFQAYMAQEGVFYMNSDLLKILTSWIIELSDEIIKDKKV